MLEQAEREKLIKLLGMTTSSHDNEALVAIRKANTLIQYHKLAWKDVIGSSAAKPVIQPNNFTGFNQPTNPQGRRPADHDDAEELVWTAKRQEIINRAWHRLTKLEKDFINNLRNRHTLSEKQRAWLDSIYDKNIGH